MHGYDVAKTARSRWPIPSDDAVTIFYAVLPLFPYLLDEEQVRGWKATIEVRLRGVVDGRWTFTFDDGKLSVDRAAGGRTDWIMSTASPAYLLEAYNRISPARVLTAMRDSL